MPIRDVEAQRRSLDNDYGVTHGDNAPDSHDLALYNGDPDAGGVEITGDGYERITLLNDAGWPPTDTDGRKERQVVGPTPTGEWDIATHWQLIGSDTYGWDSGTFTDVLEVTGAGDPPLLTLSLFYSNLYDEGA